MVIEKFLRLLGIHKCHWCKKYILPWEDFCGYIHQEMIPDGKPHTIHAKWITHVGKCTEEDIKHNRGTVK